MQSQPLLKFKDEEAYLAPEGVAVIKALPGLICPVIFIGDGRSGKSYLASRLLGSEGAFVSSDSADSVTEGIDIVVAPVDALLQGCPAETQAAAASQPDEHVLILDCEGGNNAMAAIRTLVNVFGIVLGTEVVFVANGMATEQALQNLGATLAARSLVRLDGGSKLPEQRLIFVVNKNTLRYEDSALEEMLDQRYDDPGRQEIRDNVRAAFPERDFFGVPLIGLPGVEESVQALRCKVLERRSPLTVCGTPVNGPQLSGLLDLVVSEIRTQNEVSFPSMKRFIVLDGFLTPLAGRLIEEARSALPRLDDYCADLAPMDPRGHLLASFDASSAHVAHEALLLKEARDALEERLGALWREVEDENEALGLQVLRVEQEEREVMTASRKGPLGGTGLLKSFIVTTKDMNVEKRAVVHRKRGGTPECSDWVFTQRTVVRLEESAFEELPNLPVVKGHLLKHSPNALRSMLKIMNKHHQERVCILKDGHFLWWEPEAISRRGEARGCLSFLVHRAEVLPDPSLPTAFLLRPAEKQGWMQADISFTGGQQRVFRFDTAGGEVSRDAWIQAIRCHIEFADLARQQLGVERLLREVAVYRPVLSALDGV